MFVRLVNLNGSPVWVNVLQIVKIYEIKYHNTELTLTIGSVCVKETPEEIMNAVAREVNSTCLIATHR